MLYHLFDVKNDKRLSIYLYRTGFAVWLLYIVLGAPVFKTILHYRNDCGVLSFVLMIVSFSLSMVYDYFHNFRLYESKKKWLFISYLLLAGVIFYFQASHSLHWYLEQIMNKLSNFRF